MKYSFQLNGKLKERNFYISLKTLEEKIKEDEVEIQRDGVDCKEKVGEDRKRQQWRHVIFNLKGKGNVLGICSHNLWLLLYFVSLSILQYDLCKKNKCKIMFKFVPNPRNARRRPCSAFYNLKSRAGATGEQLHKMPLNQIITFT